MLPSLLAVIPYKTFPIIQLGPLELRTFGLMVGLGVLVGAWVAAGYIERHAGVGRDDTYRLATRLVVAGVIGARLTWDITHWSDLGSPLDLIAVWKGGLQFSGGFVAAVVVSVPTFRQWSRNVRWSTIDGYALGLTIGLALGRVGCTSVGEHFGRESNWLLAVRYEGGSVRESTLGGSNHPLTDGTTFHNTAIYEFLFLLVLFGALLLISRRRPTPGTLIGIFCVYYGVARGLSDFLRVNDNTVLGLTGAQWLCVMLIPAGLYILTKVRPTTSSLSVQIGPGTPGTVVESPESEADETLGAESDTNLR